MLQGEPEGIALAGTMWNQRDNKSKAEGDSLGVQGLAFQHTGLGTEEGEAVQGVVVTLHRFYR